MMSWDVRPATTAEVDQIAQVWFDGWHEAHAHLVPADLTRIRTLESFAERLHPMLPDIRVIGAAGAPVGSARSRMTSSIRCSCRVKRAVLARPRR